MVSVCSRRTRKERRERYTSACEGRLKSLWREDIPDTNPEH